MAAIARVGYNIISTGPGCVQNSNNTAAIVYFVSMSQNSIITTNSHTIMKVLFYLSLCPKHCCGIKLSLTHELSWAYNYLFDYIYRLHWEFKDTKGM